MQKVAVLAQIAVVAAGAGNQESYVGIKAYSAEGCAEADLKSNNMMTTKSLLDAMRVEAGYSFGGCANRTTDDFQMSQKFLCDEGFMSVKTYLGSDACAEDSIFENGSYTFDCKKEDDEEKWQSFACGADTSGYSEVPMSMYDNSTSDCSSEPLGSMTMMVKLGECTAASDLNDGTWTSKSTKLSISDGVATHEEFSSVDCSGTAKSTVVTCGECSSTDDDRYMIFTCPSGGPGDASGAFQPSLALSLLALLAVGAVKA